VLALVGLALLAASAAARADGWLAPGDAGLRDDLSRLVDEAVINLPMLAWPVHASAVRQALDAIPSERGLSVSQQAAVARLRAAIGPDHRGKVSLGGAYEPLAVRRFSEEPRDEGELGVRRDFRSGSWSARLDLRLVADPYDGQPLRPDGSYVERRLGNWSLSAGWLERWWGPDWEGSTILGTAARPVPAVSIDRVFTPPFQTRWLSWIGPWTLNAFAGAMENHREDRDHPVLMGLRVAARPLKGLEIAFERTAQWCAEGLPCDFEALWNVLAGNDNQGENVDPEDEPGNQLAGWSIRWASPIGSWPYALYVQTTGEAMGKDTIPKPVQRITVRGAEIWGGRDGGRPWRLHYEYADTTCGVREESFFDCAYNNGLFDVEGYRFRGRPVGHSLDGDGRMHAVGLLLQGARGATWQFVARQMDINRGGAVPDTRHTLSPGPLEVWEAQVRADFDWLGGRVSLGLSAERQEAEGGERKTQGRGFLTYERAF
jgi:hypothetical protein